MNNTYVYAFDFDGVICDSALETGISGWKAALKFWPDMPSALPDLLLQQFRQVRPVLETGYEAILIMRLLYQGETVAALLQDFNTKIEQFLSKESLAVPTLKQVFGNTRDQWINEQLDEWLTQNPLYPGVAEHLTQLMTNHECYIVTTKQERFVTQILSASGIHFNAERIFGLEHGISKEAVLQKLAVQHTDAEIVLIEDRLPTLVEIAASPHLPSIKLYLADWGYNTTADREQIVGGEIKRLSFADFLAWR